jgi:hypothetical protein
MNSQPDAMPARKAAIEEELRARLERDRTVSPPQSPQSPLEAVALVCLECRGWNSADARFCTKCGSRFNSLVVAAAGPPPSKAGA